MKHPIAAALAALFAATALAAPQKAVTETGAVVVLEDNFTWRYETPGAKKEKESELAVNPQPFRKADAQIFQVKGERNTASVWIDPLKWAFQKNEGSEPTEFRFRLKNGDAFAMLITERTEVPLPLLLDLAVDNARNVAPDVKVLERELRTVNGVQVGRMKMTGTSKGMAFVYLGYYASGPDGSTQLVAYASPTLFSKHEAELQLFLNGLAMRRP